MPHDAIERLRRLEGTLPDPELSTALSTEIFEKAPDGLIVAEMETRRICFVNRQAEFLFGYSRTELVGQPVEILVQEHLREQHEKDTRAYSLDPRPRPMGMGEVLDGRHKSGRAVRAHIMLSPLSVPEGQFVLATIRPMVETTPQGLDDATHG